jgi:fibronectin type 3 domain-containing protein
VSAVGKATVTLAWDPATVTGATRLHGYQVYRDGSPLGPLTTATGYRDGTAVRNTAHTYFVRAVDEAGNHSESSNEVTATAT